MDLYHQKIKLAFSFTGSKQTIPTIDKYRIISRIAHVVVSSPVLKVATINVGKMRGLDAGIGMAHTLDQSGNNIIRVLKSGSMCSLLGDVSP